MVRILRSNEGIASLALLLSCHLACSLGPGIVISKINLVSISEQPRRMSEVVGGCGGLDVTACDAQGNEMISRSKHKQSGLQILVLILTSKARGA